MHEEPNMDCDRDLDHQKQLTSLLQGDGICINRILARDSSVGQSSRVYYRKPEGVPFTWEMQPGTPKNRPEEDAIPPLSPPPQLLSLSFPKPCLDHLPDIKESDHSGVRFWKKIKKIQFPQTPKGGDLDLHLHQGCNKDRSDGDFVAEFNNSCSTSSFSSSSNSSNCHANAMELPFSFCCSPWNISVILDEGDKKVYYCRVHKTAFAVESDGSLVGKTLPRNSSVGQSFRPYYRSSDDGIPFKWEMQPGTPKNPPENDLIPPPPSPSPAVQGLGLTLPANLVYSDDDEAPRKHKGSKLSRFLFWISSKKMHQGSNSLSRSSSLSSSSSSDISASRPNGLMKLSSKFRRDFLGGYFCFHPSKVQ